MQRVLLCAAVALTSACLGNVRRPGTWVEVRSPRFMVVSDAGAGKAKRTAARFEQMRAVLQQALPNARVDVGVPLVVLAVQDEDGLRALLPQFWEREGGKRPVGLFVRGLERDYVALRLDATEAEATEVVFHEYVHRVLRLNFGDLPLWLEEGLAQVFGNTAVGAKEIKLGVLDERALNQLRAGRRLPLEVLLTVGRTSPQYNDADKVSSFYAQSWELAHYLLLGDGGTRRPLLAQYLAHLDQGTEPVRAARLAFGDLALLSQELHRYARLTAYYHLPMPAQKETDSNGFSVRDLSAAESAAIRAGFLVQTGRGVEARALLEEALRLDPDLARAHEVLGALLLREGKREESLRELDRALKLNPGSVLANYLKAVVAAQSGLSASAEKGLRRVLDLAPDFAPAYAVLASLLASRGQGHEEAVALARRAVSLEPGRTAYQINLGEVLLRAGQPEQARVAGGRALAAAHTPEERALAERFLESTGKGGYPQNQAPSSGGNQPGLP